MVVIQNDSPRFGSFRESRPGREWFLVSGWVVYARSVPFCSHDKKKESRNRAKKVKIFRNHLEPA
jgi:hypothetical protein